MGRFTCSHVRPRVVEMCTPASLPTTMRDGFVGSIHMSWLSPPGAVNVGAGGAPRPPSAAGAAPPRPRPPPPPRPFAVSVEPPSMEWLKVAHKKYVSSGLSG